MLFYGVVSCDMTKDQGIVRDTQFISDPHPGFGIRPPLFKINAVGNNHRLAGRKPEGFMLPAGNSTIVNDTCRMTR
jgi:hypothetical protein